MGVSTAISWDITLVNWSTGLLVDAFGAEGSHSSYVQEVLYGTSDPGILEIGYWTITRQIPEPGAVSMMGTGLLALWFFRRHPR